MGALILAYPMAIFHFHFGVSRNLMPLDPIRLFSRQVHNYWVLFVHVSRNLSDSEFKTCHWCTDVTNWRASWSTAYQFLFLMVSRTRSWPTGRQDCGFGHSCKLYKPRQVPPGRTFQTLRRYQKSKALAVVATIDICC